MIVRYSFGINDDLLSRLNLYAKTRRVSTTDLIRVTIENWTEYTIAISKKKLSAFQLTNPYSTFSLNLDEKLKEAFMNKCELLNVPQSKVLGILFEDIIKFDLFKKTILKK